MSVMAIIGAGSGMGRAIAQTFGANGFQVALLSRHPEKLAPLVAELAAQDVEAAAFALDVLDRDSIAAGLAAVERRFGPIDVLEWSPADPTLPMVAATELTHDNVQIQIDFYVHGAVAAVNQVLHAMRARGSGTILFTTGASSVFPNPMLGNIGPASSWLRNWAHALHAAVASDGVQVGHVAINAWIGQQPGATPEAIAPLHWELYTQRDQVEKVFKPSEVAAIPQATLT
jgi:NAD(P)-dependent dehydrogenase (short-subunit alcohol dehydrogenase family)